MGHVRSVWGYRETRLGFWIHQATCTAGFVFSLIWGFPYLTEGLGYTNETAASILSVFIVATVIASFIVGPLAGRYPTWRMSMALGVGIACVLSITALAVWPDGRPPGVVVVTVFIILAIGVPTAQIGFHLVGDYNPAESMSTATGVVNAGGFIGAMILSLAVGIVLDLASADQTPTAQDYRWAMATIAAFSFMSTATMVVSLLRVRSIVLQRITQGTPVVVELKERVWDRAYRKHMSRK